MTDQTYGTGSEAGMDERPSSMGGQGSKDSFETGRRERSNEIDTERLSEAVSERASELESWIVSEVRDRPWHALGWAAAVGLFFGVIAAR